MKPAPADPSFDFELLQRREDGTPGRNRLAWLWLLGLLGLLVASIVALVLYLRTFEAEEEDRRRVADTQWLEQSVRFHFNRLEDDMAAVAHKVLGSGKPFASGQATDINGGQLWSEPGVILAHGWLPARDGATTPPILAPLRADSAAHRENAEALATMQAITRGLRRPAYAGLMRQADGQRRDVIWLAVPVFERGEFAGDYLASLSLDAAVAGLVPDWFRKNHHLRLLDNQQVAQASLPRQDLHLAQMNLQGADLALWVQPLGSQPAMVPRIFFLVALLFLLGMLASLYALRRDFGKRQRVEALLQAQVALRSAMENSVTIGLRAWALNGRILYVNQAFCRLVGFEAHELVGQTAPLPYWPRDQTDELQSLHQHIIAQGTLDTGMEVQFQHRDGHLIDVLIHEAPLNTASGEQLGWMSSVLDISERKRAERKAARQQERLEASGRLVAMGEVASTLAHELNQPLGALSSFASGLVNRLHKGGITLEEMGPVVERMNQLSDKAGRIIQRVNAFARRHEMSRQRIDLVAFMRRMMGPYRQQGTVAFRLVMDDAPLWIDADALLLEHAVHNVVSNALHWSRLGGKPATVQVSLAREGYFACVAVSDSGPGVSEEQKEHVFSAFFSATEDGMGMGLAICRSVVEAHHGRIEIGRDPVLGGARFVLWLPLSGVMPQEPVPGEEQVGSRAMPGQSVQDNHPTPAANTPPTQPTPVP
ncbi:MAG: PAS domain S-box protein [Gammaproteobacteria bacterium]|nr:PAS domain S-box protein [Gammaproteobacteria bacterium]MBU0787359.1 PAS domain S-box protein [Gammaproteobacteria bacterium]MBU0816099.1 PAS domain S-box protein [Gammaproteobacteria bacterium]MBU1787638.1 PAS domain S-box protein [Gammaproteobacteria bacterium]